MWSDTTASCHAWCHRTAIRMADEIRDLGRKRYVKTRLGEKLQKLFWKRKQWKYAGEMLFLGSRCRPNAMLNLTVISFKHATVYLSNVASPFYAARSVKLARRWTTATGIIPVQIKFKYCIWGHTGKISTKCTNWSKSFGTMLLIYSVLWDHTKL